LHLARIDGNAILGENMTKKRYFLEPKFALAKLGIEMMLPKLLQYNMDVTSMIFSSLRIDKNIINEDNHKDIKFLHEDTIHQVHKIRRCIGEAKGHDGEFIETISSRESHFWNIFFVNLNLMITQP
jgi:hypothetical protein